MVASYNRHLCSKKFPSTIRYKKVKYGSLIFLINKTFWKIIVKNIDPFSWILYWTMYRKRLLIDDFTKLGNFGLPVTPKKFGGSQLFKTSYLWKINNIFFFGSMGFSHKYLLSRTKSVKKKNRNKKKLIRTKIPSHKRFFWILNQNY